MFSAVLKKESNTVIEVSLSTKMMIQELERKKPDILGYIKNKANNFSIELKPILVEKLSEKKAYTLDEKFKKLCEKNKSLEKLKSLFNLQVSS